MCTSRPAAGPTLAFFQLLLGPANAAFSGLFLLGILDPADELVAGQRRDVLPGVECDRVGDQRHTQVSWKLVHDPTGNSQVAHSGHASESDRDRNDQLRLGIHNSVRRRDRGSWRGDRTGPSTAGSIGLAELDIAFLQGRSSARAGDSPYDPTQASTLTVGQLLVTTTLQGALRTTWSETEPRSARFSLPLPRVPTTIASAESSAASCRSLHRALQQGCGSRRSSVRARSEPSRSRCWRPLVPAATWSSNSSTESSGPACPEPAKAPSSGASMTMTRTISWSRPSSWRPADSAPKAASDPSVHKRIGDAIDPE